MAVALLVEVGAHGRRDDGHVLAPATRHHRVDGDVLGGDRDVARRDGAHDGVGVEVGGSEEIRHALGGGRDDRQTVGPPALLVVVEELGEIAVLVTRRVQRGHDVVSGIDRVRAA